MRLYSLGFHPPSAIRELRYLSLGGQRRQVLPYSGLGLISKPALNDPRGRRNMLIPLILPDEIENGVLSFGEHVL